MSDKQDAKLEALLRARRVEPASRDLAQRIIITAQSVPQNRTLPLLQWLRQLFAEFHLTKPAYVIVSALILGIIVGLSTPEGTSSSDEESAGVQSFLYADEVPL
jgi:hypothetical protein